MPSDIKAVNVRNQFRGRIRQIVRGDVISEVEIHTAWGASSPRSSRPARSMSSS